MSSPSYPGGNATTSANQQMPMYPSMQAGFIPLEESTPRNRNKFQQNRNNTPYFSGNRQNRGSNNWSQNRNRNFKQNNFRNSFNTAAGGDDDNGPDFRETSGYYGKFSNHAGGGNRGGGRYNNQQNNRRNFFNNKGNGQGFNKRQEDINILQYIHPSMIEDPWKDLMERHIALTKGNFNISEEVKRDDSSSTESDSDCKETLDEKKLIVGEGSSGSD